jgi:hypothetical protein
MASGFTGGQDEKGDKLNSLFREPKNLLVPLQVGKMKRATN